MNVILKIKTKTIYQPLMSVDDEELYLLGEIITESEIINSKNSSTRNIDKAEPKKKVSTNMNAKSNQKTTVKLGKTYLKLNHKGELIKAIDNMKNGLYKGVYINDWDVSSVIDMSELFKNRTEFNEDISKWDVSNVKDMYEMFYYAKKFDQNIGNWNVSNVTDMLHMFNGASSFNEDIK